MIDRECCVSRIVTDIDIYCEWKEGLFTGAVNQRAKPLFSKVHRASKEWPLATPSMRPSQYCLPFSRRVLQGLGYKGQCVDRGLALAWAACAAQP